MNTYLLIFRMDILTKGKQPSQSELDRYMIDWMAWIDSIADKGNLADGGNHLSNRGAVVTREGVVGTPYCRDHESVTGYIIITAAGEDEAVEIAKNCPLLAGQGTSVEVRETAAPGQAESY